jgi:hypothetical protein
LYPAVGEVHLSTYEDLVQVRVVELRGFEEVYNRQML